MVEESRDSSTVHLELGGEAQSVALVRAMLAGVAEQLDFESELLDGLNTTVSEACNNVVSHAYGEAGGPMIVHLEADQECVEVTVRDHGIGLEDVAPPEDHVGVGLALIDALSNRSEFRTHPDGGAEVRIGFHRRQRSAPSARWLDTAGATPVEPAVPGDVVGTLAPVELVGGVLGRMARLLAARARFSLERFSDLYLLFDQLGFHATRQVPSPSMSFALSTQPRRLEVEIGPVAQATDGSVPLGWEQPPPNLRVLADELTIEPVQDALMLRVVVGGADASPARSLRSG